MSSAAPLTMPRWEWRTFAPLDGELRRFQLRSFETTLVDSHEITILCLKSLHNVLITQDAIDLKWRKQVGPGGLELWDTVLRAAFPCPAEQVLRLFEAWALPAPRLLRTHYNQIQLLEEVIPQNPELRAVEFDRRTKGFLLDGASCELTELSTGRVKVESFSIEHEDPELTLQVIHRLGLQSRTNTCYPLGLKTALHLPTQH
jgi:hypothetical protein